VNAKAIARLVPDCAVLLSRLLRDNRVPRRQKLLIGAVVPYLALPFDLIPDFIPVVGQLDDAFLVAFVLRRRAEESGARPRALARRARRSRAHPPAWRSYSRAG
jgi:uncharacterized membrane protein YkvA (DUF1232 family)